MAGLRARRSCRVRRRPGPSGHGRSCGSPAYGCGRRGRFLPPPTWGCPARADSARTMRARRPGAHHGLSGGAPKGALGPQIDHRLEHAGLARAVGPGDDGGSLGFRVEDGRVKIRKSASSIVPQAHRGRGLLLRTLGPASTDTGSWSSSAPRTVPAREASAGSTMTSSPLHGLHPVDQIRRVEGDDQILAGEVAVDRLAARRRPPGSTTSGRLRPAASTGAPGWCCPGREVAPGAERPGMTPSRGASEFG